MTAAKVNQLVRRTLIQNGFRGIIPSSDARKIITKTLAQLDIQTHIVMIEQSPIHRPGETISCNCEKALIRVEPLTNKKK